MSLFNSLIVRSLPLIPKSVVRTVAKRYIAGDTVADAVKVTKKLQSIGASATIDVLGEFVESRERAVQECRASSEVLDAIAAHELDAYLSVKLTSLGLDIDDAFCAANLRHLVSKAADLGVFVRLDMENSPYTSRTLDLYRQLRSEGFDNVGVVIQAYMRRSESDIRSLMALKADVRLCKGIYIEDESIVYKGREEIRTNYRKLFRLLLDGGMKVRCATHDDELLSDVEEFVARHSVSRTDYEIQMLLGVREDRRDRIIRSGHPMRIYVPVGEDWYGYSTRRLKENPQVAGYIVKAMFGLSK